MKKVLILGLSVITLGSIITPGILGAHSVAYAEEVTTTSESNSNNSSVYTVRSEDITQDVIDQIESVTAKDVVEYAKKLGYNPEDIWTKEELDAVYSPIQPRADVNKMVEMSNDLKYFYMSSFTAKLAVTVGSAAIGALFPGVGASIVAAAVGLIISENVNFDNGIVVRLTRDKTTNILIPTAVWSQ